MTLRGFETTAFRLLGHCLNQMRHCVYIYIHTYIIYINIRIIIFIAVGSFTSTSFLVLGLYVPVYISLAEVHPVSGHEGPEGSSGIAQLFL